MPKLELDQYQLDARHLALVQELARLHAPEAEVWAYGSRLGSRLGSGFQECSDIDLVLRNKADLDEPIRAPLWRFEEALDESTLPFLVDVMDWAEVPEHFHTSILERYVVLQEGQTPTEMQEKSDEP